METKEGKVNWALVQFNILPQTDAKRMNPTPTETHYVLDGVQQLVKDYKAIFMRFTVSQ